MGRMMLLLALFLLIEALAVIATETAENLNVAPHRNKVRRLGNHQHSTLISGPPCVSPSEPPLPNNDKVNYNYSEGVTIISSLNQEHATTQEQQQQQQQQSAQNITNKNGKHHHSVDKSVAGGGVILGGLATTLLVAIACYIRATRRKKVEPTSPSSASSPTRSKV